MATYNLGHQIRRRLREQGIDDSWETVRTTMSTQVRVTTSLPGENAQRIHVRESSRPNADQQRLIRALGLACLPGRTQKTVVTT